MTTEDVAELIRQRTGLTVYSGYMPPADEVTTNCAVVTSTGGAPNIDLIGFDELTFQVRTRGAEYAIAETSAQAIYDALHGAMDVAISDSLARYILAIQRPFSMGHDANDNAEFSTNYRMKLHKA